MLSAYCRITQRGSQDSSVTRKNKKIFYGCVYKFSQARVVGHNKTFANGDILWLLKKLRKRPPKRLLRKSLRRQRRSNFLLLVSKLNRPRWPLAPGFLIIGRVFSLTSVFFASAFIIRMQPVQRGYAGLASGKFNRM